MSAIVRLLLIKEITVIPLACLVWGASRFFRRPALTHLLWVLILVKLVTPPLFQLSWVVQIPDAILPAESDGYRRVANTTSEISAQNNSVPFDSPVSRSPFTPSPIVSQPRTGERQSEPINGGITEQRTTHVASMNRNEPPSASKDLMISGITKWWPTNSATVASFLFNIWSVGTVGWFTMQIVRGVRFQRRVARAAISCDPLRAETDALAFRMGLRRTPHLVVVDAAISPMLWSWFGGPTLLFPADLARRLDQSRLETLLTHELAHFQRGDHWVRWLELLGTGLFWWHPVVWWARRKIEQSEEECCDAMVVSQFPSSPRRYAEALLDTIDYLCETRRALPPLASGLGEAPFLRRRLVQIMQRARPIGLSSRLRWAVMLVAMVIMSFQPFAFAARNILLTDSMGLDNSAVYTTNEDRVSGSTIHKMDIDFDKTISSTATRPTAPRPATAPPMVVNRKAVPTVIRAVRGERTWSTIASPDGRFVARATTGRRLMLIDLNSNREFDLSGEGITAIAFSPDSQRFVAASSDGRVTLWDAALGQVARTLLTHTDGLSTVAVSPDGLTIAAGGRDGTLLLGDIATGSLLRGPEKFSIAVNCVRFSPDGRTLAIAVGNWQENSPGQVFLWNTESEDVFATLDSATVPGALAYASSDELIVGQWNGHAELWNLKTGRIVGSAVAEKNMVAAAAFSPDNPILTSLTFQALTGP